MKNLQLSAAASLFLLGHGFPLFGRRPSAGSKLLEIAEREAVPMAQASYSVVPVDGSSSVNAPATTIVEPTTSTQIQTSISTVISTIVSTDAETVITTIRTATVTVEGPTSVEVVTATPTSNTDGIAITQAQATATVTFQPSVSSSAYDNGMWHTTYYSMFTVASPEAIPIETSVTTPSLSSTISTSLLGETSRGSDSPMPSSASASSANFEAAATTSASLSSTSAEVPKTTDWATYYGTWQSAPVNGSWWGPAKPTSA